jgi:hypothetical protein
MDERYKDLQACIYTTEEEHKRFRQLVVNSVMATDIFDKDMKAIREKRWDKAFHIGMESTTHQLGSLNIDKDTNMKATIVIEHIIQASDVAVRFLEMHKRRCCFGPCRNSPWLVCLLFLHTAHNAALAHIPKMERASF